MWLDHASFIIKLGNTTIITDPVFEKNYGPLWFGPKKYVKSPLTLKELPKIDLFLGSHNHYDHFSIRTIKNFPYKDAKVLVPLKLGKYFTKTVTKKKMSMKWIGLIKLKLTMILQLQCYQHSIGANAGYGALVIQIEVFGEVF